MEFKDKLRKLRKEKGISQQMLADQIFVSRSAIAKWENGLGFPGQDSCAALINYFGVEEDYFHTKSPETVIINKNLRIRLLKLAVSAVLFVFFLFLSNATFHWFTTVVPEDTEGMERHAAHYLGYDSLKIVKTVQRGDVTAALCVNRENVWSLCVFFRDSFFPNRWRANGGIFRFAAGELVSWNYGDSQTGAVLVFCGSDLPDRAAWYTFRNSGTIYICPVKDHMALELFIIPDSYDISGSPVPLDENFQPLM